MNSSKYRIGILKGDGIGPEVVSSATEVLQTACTKHSLGLRLTELEIGMQAYRKYGRTFPIETLEALRSCDGWILGPLQAGAYPRDDKDHPFASGQIRKMFDLYANIRPVRSVLPDKRRDIDLVIVRENTEGFYPDRNLFRGHGEFWPNEDTVLSLRVVTRKACRRIAETAFALARVRSRKRLVTAIHKGNVLIEGDGLFLEEVRKAAKAYPDIRLEEKLVDSAALQLVTSPESFDVMVTTNLFGDVLSDEAAGLIGGLGLAPSLNSGEQHAMAQAVHGSAPDIAGKGIANPVALILSTAMLLQWLYSKHPDDLALGQTAQSILAAVEEQLGSAPDSLTPDLGGTASTLRFTQALLGQLGR